ncbi:hypothetical protein ACAF76_008505 [Brevibacillus sp. TJ4]|uniref:hypothetical protein n=1 Tax=Brevibacillus sp. TJ4 TaxID=3234853 RepID=UPI0037CECC19
MMETIRKRYPIVGSGGHEGAEVATLMTNGNVCAKRRNTLDGLVTTNTTEVIPYRINTPVPFSEVAGIIGYQHIGSVVSMSTDKMIHFVATSNGVKYSVFDKTTGLIGTGGALEVGGKTGITHVFAIKWSETEVAVFYAQAGQTAGASQFIEYGLYNVDFSTGALVNSAIVPVRSGNVHAPRFLRMGSREVYIDFVNNSTKELNALLVNNGTVGTGYRYPQESGYGYHLTYGHGRGVCLGSGRNVITMSRTDAPHTWKIWKVTVNSTGTIAAYAPTSDPIMADANYVTLARLSGDKVVAHNCDNRDFALRTYLTYIDMTNAATPVISAPVEVQSFMSQYKQDLVTTSLGEKLNSHLIFQLNPSADRQTMPIVVELGQNKVALVGQASRYEGGEYQGTTRFSSTQGYVLALVIELSEDGKGIVVYDPFPLIYNSGNDDQQTIDIQPAEGGGYVYYHGHYTKNMQAGFFDASLFDAGIDIGLFGSKSDKHTYLKGMVPHGYTSNGFRLGMTLYYSTSTSFPITSASESVGVPNVRLGEAIDNSNMYMPDFLGFKIK